MEDHPPYCRKEAEIAEMRSKIETIKRIVMGNGQEGLNTMVPKLNENIKSLTRNIDDLGRGVSGLTKFTEYLKGENHGRQGLRKRNQWIIGTLIAVAAALIAGMAVLIEVVTNHLQ